MAHKTIHIDLGSRSYDIHIGSKLLANITEYIPKDITGRRAFIIADENTVRLAEQIKENLGGTVYVLPSGEKTKSYEQLQNLHDWMLSEKIDRKSVIYAVGGGVIGDLAGFAAATILRGIPFVQIPTSLLAQVDSSVGGKTGINTKHGKNLIGNFYQPSAVIADIETLKTLPKRELLAGYAEVVKYGLINDKAFFEWLLGNHERVLNLEEEAISHAIDVSCQSKAKIVEEDEREGGRRALLNLGHTFGHALEAVAGYDGSLLHGEAISVGMVMAFDVSAASGFCSEEDAKIVRGHFETVGLPVDVPWMEATSEELIEYMRGDKKAADGKITFIMAYGIGNTFITQDVDVNHIHDILSRSLKGGA
ncbi:MAG: 3-dehydroquinate synthase [Alphaproteobacteria bacterium]|nr:3-dehydroquinate synthase [Alphaproteobacteria bacterium]